MVPVVLPRCTTPSLGRSPRANRCKTDDSGLVLIFKKNQKYVIFIFSFDLHTDIILKQLNKYTHALSLAGLGVHVSSLSDSMNAIILAQVDLNQNSIHCFFFLGLGKG